MTDDRQQMTTTEPTRHKAGRKDGSTAHEQTAASDKKATESDPTVWIRTTGRPSARNRYHTDRDCRALAQAGERSAVPLATLGDDYEHCAYCSGTHSPGRSLSGVAETLDEMDPEEFDRLVTDGSGCWFCEGYTDYHPTCDRPDCDNKTHGHGDEGKTTYSYCTEHRAGETMTDGGQPHPHWLFRARSAHERLSGGGSK